MKQQEAWKEERERGISKMIGLLKFITCGSVDDGKSTLIGHILYDSKLLYTDQEEALELDSKVGSRGGKIDYSLFLTGQRQISGNISNAKKLILFHYILQKNVQSSRETEISSWSMMTD